MDFHSNVNGDGVPVMYFHEMIVVLHNSLCKTLEYKRNATTSKFGGNKRFLGPYT